MVTEKRIRRVRLDVEYMSGAMLFSCVFSYFYHPVHMTLYLQGIFPLSPTCRLRQPGTVTAVGMWQRLLARDKGSSGLLLHRGTQGKRRRVSELKP
jgi:hypothetical protein